MDNQPLNYKTVVDIVMNGIYYNPSWKHYERETSVTCDRCRRNNIDMCIGYKTYDLCLPCVVEINSELTNKIVKPVYQPEIKLKMLQRQFEPVGKQIMTMMMQGQFEPMQEEIMTFMQQRQFMTNMEQSQFRQKRVKTYMQQGQFRQNNDTITKMEQRFFE